jgi:hypothetical protein
VCCPAEHDNPEHVYTKACTHTQRARLHPSAMAHGSDHSRRAGATNAPNWSALPENNRSGVFLLRRIKIPPFLGDTQDAPEVGHALRLVCSLLASSAPRHRPPAH